MTHRIIYSLNFELEPLPTDPAGSSCSLVVKFNREGNCDARNSIPRHKARTIDLRVGDELLCNGQWRTIKAIEPYRDNWTTDEDAATRPYAGGYSVVAVLMPRGRYSRGYFACYRPFWGHPTIAFVSRRL